ncbi:hypothetical protein [Porphyromonas somerae]|uniref:hypothetical protein n=1 Tax=Porphyromonas somerae TaxID=322095 RepID=UPI002A75BB98|nr:hypothetical protein [Porphyromonas somerae]MDY3119460.1 hypothetical protein [Porphyromonas somerae]
MPTERGVGVPYRTGRTSRTPNILLVRKRVSDLSDLSDKGPFLDEALLWVVTKRGRAANWLLALY